MKLLTLPEPPRMIIRRGYDDPPGRSTLNVSNNTTTPCTDQEGILLYHGIPAKRCMYAGVQFRSIAEASWARALDLLGFLWQYEPTTFAEHEPESRLRGQLYTPDFKVISAAPNSFFLLEVKGTDDQLRNDLPRIERVMKSLDSPLRNPACAGLVVVPPYYNLNFHDDERLMFSRMSYDPDTGFYVSASTLWSGDGWHGEEDHAATQSAWFAMFLHPKLRSPKVPQWLTIKPRVFKNKRHLWERPRELAETYKTSGEITYLD
jgi:hypothetical protein